jgi:hypothetical protein
MLVAEAEVSTCSYVDLGVSQKPVRWCLWTFELRRLRVSTAGDSSLFNHLNTMFSLNCI